MADMYLMTGAQSRMARSLLKWSREYLAKEANVSRNTICAFEDDTAIREAIILDIQSVFDAHGVECLPDGSVRPRTDGIKDFRGLGSCDRFFANIKKMLAEKPTDVICMIANQNMLTKSTGRNHLCNFERLQELSKIAKVKCLLEDKRIYLPGTPLFEVRINQEVPSSLFLSQFGYAEELSFAFEQDPRFNFRHPVYGILESPYHAKKVFEHFAERWLEAQPYVTPLSKKIGKNVPRQKAATGASYDGLKQQAL